MRQLLTRVNHRTKNAIQSKENWKEGDTVSGTERIWNFHARMEPVLSLLFDSNCDLILYASELSLMLFYNSTYRHVDISIMHLFSKLRPVAASNCVCTPAGQEVENNLSCFVENLSSVHLHFFTL